MYAIKQIKICAEYRDMLPRPRLDLSGTPGLRPIGLSPGSWQTSLGLGSMSRYSAQILICIIQFNAGHVCLFVWVWVCVWITKRFGISSYIRSKLFYHQGDGILMKITHTKKETHGMALFGKALVFPPPFWYSVCDICAVNFTNTKGWPAVWWFAFVCPCSVSCHQ